MTTRDRHTIEALPRRRAVERTCARSSTHRPAARDDGSRPARHEAMIARATIALDTRRLTQTTHKANTHMPAGATPCSRA